MENRIEQRIAQLRKELDRGQRMLNEMDARRAELQATILRISGAIQVLEELLEAAALATPTDGQGEAVLASKAVEIDES
jgi:uncharacterized coiled-coil DUF342 family protein